MPRRLSKRDDGLSLEADINITSLVDVAFTLLVIFIITAPILQGGIEVSVPQADVAPLRPTEAPVFVSIDAQDRIFLEETEFESVEAFRSSFAELATAGGWEVVYLRADRGATFGTVMPILAAIEDAEGVGASLVG
ncbi:MAG TPA: biopolymer transporter ExbD, partial [Myxococcota bacterium]|nr:biopolymer transporter ExbD [Myxococcota bacterium]